MLSKGQAFILRFFLSLPLLSEVGEELNWAVRSSEAQRTLCLVAARPNMILCLVAITRCETERRLTTAFAYFLHYAKLIRDISRCLKKWSFFDVIKVTINDV